MEKLSIIDSSLEEDFVEVSNSAAEFFPDRSEEQICDAPIGILREYQRKADWHGRKPMEPQNFLSWGLWKAPDTWDKFIRQSERTTEAKTSARATANGNRSPRTATLNRMAEGNGYSNFSIG